LLQLWKDNCSDLLSGNNCPVANEKIYFVENPFCVNVDTNAEEIYSNFNTDVIDEGHVTNGRNYVFYILDI